MEGCCLSPDFSQFSAAARGSHALAASGLILTAGSVYTVRARNPGYRLGVSLDWGLGVRGRVAFQMSQAMRLMTAMAASSCTMVC